MKKKTEPKNVRLASYFFLLVIFIIIVSLIFKAADVVRHSKFDGKHSFSVAVFQKNSTDVIFVSPQDGSITQLLISPKVDSQSLKSLGVPVDGALKYNSDLSGPKSVFIKAILHRNSTQTDLTILDLLRLSFFTQRVGADKITNQSVSARDAELADITGKMFIDPTINNEKVSIQITNATQTPGLGNKVAKYISDLGGNVVLVNSSPSPVKQSVIYFKNDSYTVDRISKVLGIRNVKKGGSAISDVTVIMGEDKSDF